MRKLVLLFAALLIVGCGEQSLSGSTIEKALEEAVELDSLQVRGDLYYQPYKWKPYGGWIKETYDSGRVKMLWQVKDGKEDGLHTKWHENGQKKHEDGQYWNSSGEEAEASEVSEE